MIFKDYYKILELETNDVNMSDIKTAYREQAKKYHPDVNVGNKSAEERFKDINEAYNILSNLTTKKKYDRMWNSKIAKKRAKEASKNKKNASVKEEMLGILFGKKDEGSKENTTNKKQKNIPIQGDDIESEITITIKEAFEGQTKKISLKTTNGQMKTFNIKIPEGIRNKEKIRLIGQGKSGTNGGKNGNLLIKVTITDDGCYRLVGSDIYQDILITPWEAIFGAKVECNGINESFSVFIPKGAQNGEELRIKEKGYKKGMGERGDLVLQIKIMVPKNLSDEEKELYKKLKQISKFNPRQMYL